MHDDLVSTNPVQLLVAHMGHYEIEILQLIAEIKETKQPIHIDKH